MHLPLVEPAILKQSSWVNYNLSFIYLIIYLCECNHLSSTILIRCVKFSVVKMACDLMCLGTCLIDKINNSLQSFHAAFCAVDSWLSVLIADSQGFPWGIMKILRIAETFLGCERVFRQFCFLLQVCTPLSLEVHSNSFFIKFSC